MWYNPYNPQGDILVLEYVGGKLFIHQSIAVIDNHVTLVIQITLLFSVYQALKKGHEFRWQNSKKINWIASKPIIHGTN